MSTFVNFDLPVYFAALTKSQIFGYDFTGGLDLLQ